MCGEAGFCQRRRQRSFGPKPQLQGNKWRSCFIITLQYGALESRKTQQPTTTPFTDQDSISSWARDGVMTIQAAGMIINGHPDGRFAPQDTATRAQTVTANSSAVSSEDVVFAWTIKGGSLPQQTGATSATNTSGEATFDFVNASHCQGGRT